ncbi:MAG: sugar phosphate isomerase/epimerase, partial [Desulfosarcinaceae bacterium]
CRWASRSPNRSRNSRQRALLRSPIYAWARSRMNRNPDQFEPLFSAFPGFRFILDLAHAYIGERSSARCLEFLERFGDRLAHLHVSDNHGKHDEHLPLGCGSLPLKPIAKALRKAGYDDTCTLEIFVEDRRALVKSRDKFASLLAGHAGGKP